MPPPLGARSPVPRVQMSPRWHTPPTPLPRPAPQREGLEPAGPCPRAPPLCPLSASGHCSRGQATRVSAQMGPRHAHGGSRSREPGQQASRTPLYPHPREALGSPPYPGDRGRGPQHPCQRQDSCFPHFVDGATESKGSGASDARSSARQRLSPPSPMARFLRIPCSSSHPVCPQRGL